MYWSRTPRPTPHTSFRPFLEALETRLVPYALTSYSWPNPQLVTLSFVPDGTFIVGGSWGNQYSNLYARMSNYYKGSGLGWQDTILKAAQMWAQQTNINFALVSDNGAAFESGKYQQGDPGMGDIRFSSIDLGNGSGGTVTYAEAFYPPTDTGDSAEGDVILNNEYRYGNGVGVVDLWSVAVHEIGHALGLAHTSATGMAVMWPTYTLRTKLNADDIAGIQAIYGGPRKTDRYESAGQGVSFATAVDLSSQINPLTQSAVITGLDNTTSTDAGYYSFTAPLLSASTATVTVQSSGLSLLAPVLTVYAADQTTVLGTATATGETGATLSVTLSNVTPGTKYYIKVSGNASVGGTQATGAFATGAYALTLNLGTGPAPTVPLPDTQVPISTGTGNGASPIEGSGVQPDAFPDHDAEPAQAAPAATTPNTAGPATSLALPAGAANVTQTPAAAAPPAAGVTQAATFSAPVRVALSAYTNYGGARGEDAGAPDADVAVPAAAPAAPADQGPADPAVRPAAGSADTAPALEAPAAAVDVHPADAVFAGKGEAFEAAPVLSTAAPVGADDDAGARDHVLLAATLGLAWAYLPCRTPRRGERRPADLAPGADELN
jgi:hypothetical protein